MTSSVNRREPDHLTADQAFDQHDMLEIYMQQIQRRKSMGLSCAEQIASAAGYTMALLELDLITCETRVEVMSRFESAHFQRLHLHNLKKSERSHAL